MCWKTHMLPVRRVSQAFQQRYLLSSHPKTWKSTCYWGLVHTKEKFLENSDVGINKQGFKLPNIAACDKDVNQNEHKCTEKPSYVFLKARVGDCWRAQVKKLLRLAAFNPIAISNVHIGFVSDLDVLQLLENSEMKIRLLGEQCDNICAPRPCYCRSERGSLRSCDHSSVW